MVSTRTMATAAVEEVSPRRRGRPPKKPAAAAEEAPRSPSPVSPLVAAAKEAAAEGYERKRDERIRENLERMQKLGILDLAHRFSHAASATAGRGRGRRPWSPGAAREKAATASPARRSLRLKNVTPVSYAEIPLKKEKDLEIESSNLIEQGSKEEVYTEEHEKLLGTCGVPWTLFVDGYGEDGKRIYDQVRGQTCHQCRQKTLGHHTRCCKCQIVQGQFCGDCLYMRYGENILEAKKNPNWICPVCRGICNCSICRAKKGWSPTGTLYRKVASLGYKSVAHYLIQTRRSSASPADSNSADSTNKLPPCTKSETSSISENAPVVDQGQEGAEMSSKVGQDGGSKMPGKSSKKIKDEITSEPHGKNADGCNNESTSESVVTSDVLDCQANEAVGCITPAKQGPKKRKLIEQSPDCVASRLRSRSNKS